MLLTFIPIVTFFNFLQFLKAFAAIPVTLYLFPLNFIEDGIITEIIFFLTGFTYWTVFLDLEIIL